MTPWQTPGGMPRAAAGLRRSGGHEATIREYSIGPRGLTVGEPLTEFQGVLRGVPTYFGSDESLSKHEPVRDSR